MENISSVGLGFKVSIVQREHGEANEPFLNIRSCLLEIVEWFGLEEP